MDNRERFWQFVRFQKVDHLPFWADWLGPWQRWRDEHLNPHAPGRYPEDAQWEAMKLEWQNHAEVISIDGGSFYGFLRDWIGFENLSYLLYDEPELIGEMMDYLADFFIQVLHRAVKEVDIDFAMFWEDMCYKTGPLLSPAMFRKFMLPNYRKVTAFLIENGIELSWVDCDGILFAETDSWAHWEPKVGSYQEALEMIRVVTTMRRGAVWDYLVFSRRQAPAKIRGMKLILRVPIPSK